jgi:release factor glutamine methyltransferase
LNSNGIDCVVNPGVYIPSDDTYLLMDSISLTKTDSFLEVGCGAGLVTVAAAKCAKIVMAIDISLHAVKNTIENLEKNGQNHCVSVFQGDLLTAIQSQSHFTVIAFNPPYLPHDDISSGLDQATIGGPEGTEISERFLIQAVNHLDSDGRVYLVCSTLSKMERIQSVMETLGLCAKIIASKKLFCEELYIIEGCLLESHTETVL